MALDSRRYCDPVVKLTDVARAAGVGYGTASRAISGKGAVDEQTRAHILETANKLGYRRDAAARALRERRTRSVGLVVPDIINEFYTSSAEVLQGVLDDADHQLFVATTGNHVLQEQRALQSMLDRQVDGLVHVPVQDQPDLPTTLPTVELNRYSQSGRPAVISDDVNGIAELTQLVLDAGYTDIAVITGPLTFSTSRDRLAGFRLATARAGYTDDPRADRRIRVITTDFSASGGSQALDSLRDNPPTAVVALSSRLVLGVLRSARRLNISIPGELALAGYGDPDWYEVWGPGITTFAPPLATMGALAGSTLLSLINHEPVSSDIQRLSGQICERGTVPPANKRSIPIST